MTNTKTVGEIYQAFGRGDIESILEHLAEDVVWDHFEHGNSGQDAGLPYLEERSGKGEVGGFFAALNETLEFEDFSPVDLLRSDDRVIGVIDETVVNRRTGKRFTDRAVHIWSFDAEGRVTGFEHVIDTAKHIEAAVD